MMYVDNSVKSWLERYPALKVAKEPCHTCGKIMIADIPFIEKGWAGLCSLDCKCGQAPGISIVTPISPETQRLMDGICSHNELE